MPLWPNGRIACLTCDFYSPREVEGFILFCAFTFTSKIDEARNQYPYVITLALGLAAKLRLKKIIASKFEANDEI